MFQGSKESNKNTDIDFFFQKGWIPLMITLIRLGIEGKVLKLINIVTNLYLYLCFTLKL